MSFNVIPPLTIASSMLTYSSVAEPDTGERMFSLGATFAMDEQAIDPTTHRKYQSLVAGNTNHPLPVWPVKQNEFWYWVGWSNRWAMFDLNRNTATKKDGAIVVHISPGVRVDSLALRGLKATSVLIEMLVGSEVVYTYSKNLSRRIVRNAFDYCFGIFKTQPNVTRFDLPPYSGALIRVTITNDWGAAQCAGYVIGTKVMIGMLTAGAESDVLNFSVIERDSAGNADLQPEPNGAVLVGQIVCKKSDVNLIRELRDALNAVPAVYSGISNDDDGYAEAVDICGIYKKFSINLKHTDHAIVSLQLETI